MTSSLFTGLSAFPLTPFSGERVDLPAFSRLVERLAAAGVDSIGALGSTGSYMYLSREERKQVASAAVAAAGDVPVFVGVGTLRTSWTLEATEDAQAAGAQAVLVAVPTYQALRDDEVLGLFEAVSAASSVPVIVYDNPGTTHVTYSEDVYTAITALPQVASVKIPPVTPAPEHPDPAAAEARIDRLRTVCAPGTAIGISGDAQGAAALTGGADLWYTAVGGTLPEPMLTITRAAQAGERDRALALSAGLQPLWDLCARYGGSARVSAAIAEELGLVGPDCLPAPLKPLPDEARTAIRDFLAGV